MRILTPWLPAIMLLLPAAVTAQQPAIENALAKGQAADLGVHFHSTVELSIPGTEDVYAADKAVTLLADFFTRAVVKGYKRNHLSTPQDGRTHYSIGDLQTAKGTYRITLYYNAARKITEIKIQ